MPRRQSPFPARNPHLWARNRKTVRLKDPNESKNQKRNSRINAFARFSGIAFQMIAIILLGTYGGMKLDESHPNDYSIYTVICSLLSVGIAMYFVIKQVNKYTRDQNRKK